MPQLEWFFELQCYITILSTGDALVSKRRPGHVFNQSTKFVGFVWLAERVGVKRVALKRKAARTFKLSPKREMYLLAKFSDPFAGVGTGGQA